MPLTRLCLYRKTNQEHAWEDNVVLVTEAVGDVAALDIYEYFVR